MFWGNMFLKGCLMNGYPIMPDGFLGIRLYNWKFENVHDGDPGWTNPTEGF